MEDYDYDGSNCDILIEYNPCVTDHFVCRQWSHDDSVVQGYYEGEEDCASDFEDRDFWMALREDSFWMREENWHLQDFYMFWDMFHSDDYGHDDYGHDDYDHDDYMECEWKLVEPKCTDFEFLGITDGDCYISVEYNPCETDYFMCTVYQLGQDDEDCTEDFLDADFWMMMRDEEWWFEEANAEYRDFHMFWDMYHFSDDYGHDDYDHDDYMDCEWKTWEGDCQVWEFA
jgi:hypothetical protein